MCGTDLRNIIFLGTMTVIHTVNDSLEGNKFPRLKLESKRKLSPQDLLIAQLSD